MRFKRNVVIKIVLIGHVYTLVGYGDAGIPFIIFRMNEDFLYNVVMAECTCTVGEMNAMLIGVFLNKIVVCFFGCLLLLFGFFWVVSHGLGSHCPWLSFTTSRQ